MPLKSASFGAWRRAFIIPSVCKAVERFAGRDCSNRNRPIDVATVR